MVEKVALTDGFIVLRSYQPSDAELLNRAVRESMAELSLWFPWCNADYSFENGKSFIASRPEAWRSGRDYTLAILEARDGTYLGNCSLFEVRAGDKTASASYWVRSSRTGEGIATAAMRLLARFGFEELELNRIEIIVAIDNRPSLRVAEKSGATREGVLRDRFSLGDKIHDAVMFSLIPTDLR